MKTIGDYYDEKYKDAATIRAEIKKLYQVQAELVEHQAKLWKVAAVHKQIAQLQLRLEDVLHVGD